MVEEYTVEVTFEDYGSVADAESYVKHCLTGNRARSFIDKEDVKNIELVEEDDGNAADGYGTGYSGSGFRCPSCGFVGTYMSCQKCGEVMNND